MGRYAVLCAACVFPVQGQEHTPVVALDGYHKHETVPHYRWDGTYAGGYSQFGALLESLGTSLETITTPLSASSLAGTDCLLIVAPDTPNKVAQPAYIEKDEINSITKWVRRGGTLILFGNDPGNSEFKHLNELAAKFGVRFLEETHHDAQGGVKVTLHAGSGQTIVSPDARLYAVQIAPLSLSSTKAIRLYEDNGQVLMVSVAYGRGRVLAFGDPWLYNEYIHTDDNYEIAAHIFRWLLHR